MSTNLSLEDRTWENVLELLSQGGRLSKLYKMPKHEVQAVLKAHSSTVDRDLALVFQMVIQKRALEVPAFLSRIGDYRCYAMLHNLIRCMRCWVESGSPVQTVRRRWRVANA